MSDPLPEQPPATTLDRAPWANHQRAPGTTRDAAPGTTLDGAPGTTLDRPRATPGTTLDGAPGTRLDRPPGTPSASTTGYHRVNLPPDLAARYEPVRDLGSGGEADVLLVRDRQTGESVVMRIYRRADMPIDADKLNRLRAADPRHLIRLLDWGQGHGYSWEKLEYAGGGSLDDMRRAHPGPWSPEAVWNVLTQLAPAVDYAHSMRMVHRDIKPGNILVRGHDPLDLVLADFGLARFLAQTREMRTSSRTSAYAAPEAATGDTSTALDWWSLGIVMVELLTGRSPFQRLDGSWMDDVMIVRELTVHDVDLSGIRDERWKLLCRGLLTRAPEDRWNAEKVARWCNGEQVTVAAPKGPVFVFGHSAYTEPVALAEAFRTQWTQARRLCVGQQVNAPQFLALRDWARKRQLTEVVELLGDQSNRPDRLLTQLIAALDPDSPPMFCQGPFDHRSLIRLATEAVDRPAGVEANVVDLAYDDGILPVLDGRPGCDGYAMLDARWRRLCEDLDARLERLGNPVDPLVRRRHRAMMLLAAHPGQEQMLGPDATAAAHDRDALDQPWFGQLTVEPVPPDLAPAHHAAIIHSGPIAHEQTHRMRMAHQVAVAQAERTRQFQQQKSLDDASAIIGVLCGVLGCIPFLGIVAGPAAVYFGYRARRGGHTTASFFAFALGIIGVLTFFCFMTNSLSATP